MPNHLEPGEWMMIFLVFFYAATAITFAYSRNWPKMFYWIGAAVITTSVLVMK